VIPAERSSTVVVVVILREVSIPARVTDCQGAGASPKVDRQGREKDGGRVRLTATRMAAEVPIRRSSGTRVIRRLAATAPLRSDPPPAINPRVHLRGVKTPLYFVVKRVSTQ